MTCHVMTIHDCDVMIICQGYVNILPITAIQFLITTFEVSNFMCLGLKAVFITMPQTQALEDLNEALENQSKVFRSFSQKSIVHFVFDI